MEIIRHIDDIPRAGKGAVGVLGNFDGFHRGHQVVVGEAGRLARKLKKPLMVIMTEPHPRSFFNPDAEPFRLTPFRERLALLETFGVDIAVVLHFDAALSNLTPEIFAGDILKNGLDISHVVVGYDYRFGKGRTGDVGVLKELGEKFNFGVIEIPPVPIGIEGAAGQPYSSTLVRAALKDRKPRKAAAFLGHWWTINGKIMDGEKRGRKIGFPTANIEIRDSIVPGYGVYAVRAMVEGAGDALIDGVANIGVRPTFGEEKLILEAHLFDFGGEHYGRHIRLHFIGGIRPEQEFENLEALKAQIARDCKSAQILLNDPENAHNRLSPPTLENYLKEHPKPVS